MITEPIKSLHIEERKLHQKDEEFLHHEGKSSPFEGLPFTNESGELEDNGAALDLQLKLLATKMIMFGDTSYPICDEE